MVLKSDKEVLTVNIQLDNGTDGKCFCRTRQVSLIRITRYLFLVGTVGSQKQFKNVFKTGRDAFKKILIQSGTRPTL